MKKLLFLLVFTTSLSTGQDFDINEFYPIERGHSYVSFSVTYMGYARVKGNFKQFSGTFRYNPEKISSTSISLVIDVASIDTDLEFRDNDLRSENWFDAATYPKIVFTSTSVRKGEGGLVVKGKLTAKNVTKEIEVPMVRTSGVLNDVRGDEQVIFTGSYTISRKDFGISGDRWSQMKEGIVGVSDNVTVEFSFLGKQIKERNYQNWVRNEEQPPGKLYAAYKEGGLDSCLDLFNQLASQGGLRPGALNTVGYMLLKTGKYDDAVKVIARNLEKFPDVPGLYDSLAEAYAHTKDLDNSKKYYQLSLEKDPENYNAREILRHFQ